MDAFHGGLHIYSCQINNHPQFVPGTCLSDLVDCERHFSQSNRLATTTRHASKFHRLQAMDNHYRYQDSQHYENLGRYMLNNYRQAYDIIDKTSKSLGNMRATKGFTGDDYEAWLVEERAYLATVGKEPEDEKNMRLYYEAYVAWRTSQ
jgi:hypothetical protein